MSWSTYLSNALVAGALAAGTNHLAIVAILRHILPRKKSEIARRIRNIVATDLVSPDKMRDKMDDPAVQDMLHRHIADVLGAFLAKDLPAPAELLGEHREAFSALLLRLRESLLDELRLHCERPEFGSEVIRPFLEERWRVLGARTPDALLAGQRAALIDFLAERVRELHHSQTLRNGVRRALDDWLAERVDKSRSLGELLPSSLSAAAEELAAAQAPVVLGQLIDTLRQPDIQEAIASSIMGAISAQLRGQGILGGIKGAVVNVMRVENDVHGLCLRLPDTVRDSFSRPDRRERFAVLLRDAVRKGLEQDLNQELRTPGRRDAIIGRTMDRLWRPEMFERLGAETERLAESVFDRSFEEIAAKLGAASPDAMLDEVAERFRRILASKAVRRLLARQFDEFAEAWLRRPLGRLDRFVAPESVDRLSGAAAAEARLMLRERLAELAEESGVWDIVTTSIEGYDNRQLEGMIKQLARSELRWVTILGGVVGVAVGLAQTFLQSL